MRYSNLKRFINDFYLFKPLILQYFMIQMMIWMLNMFLDVKSLSNLSDIMMFVN